MDVITVMASVSLGIGAAQNPPPSGWRVISDPAELRLLYSNKTFRAVSFDGAPSASRFHYRADGRALWVIGARRIKRTWRIVGRDQVCVRDAVVGRQCVRVQRNRKYPNELLIRQVGSHFATFVTVEEGIPNF